MYINNQTNEKKSEIGISHLQTVFVYSLQEVVDEILSNRDFLMLCDKCSTYIEEKLVEMMIISSIAIIVCIHLHTA